VSLAPVRSGSAVGRIVAIALLSALLTVTVGAPPVGAASVKDPHEFSGSGSARTPTFELPDQWTLKWSFDCSASISRPGIFSVQVVVADANAARLNLLIPRLLRFDTEGSGTEHYDHGGHRAFLRIASPCSWTVKAARLAS
jgi:hypothetical protein